MRNEYINANLKKYSEQFIKNISFPCDMNDKCTKYFYTYFCWFLFFLFALFLYVIIVCVYQATKCIVPYIIFINELCLNLIFLYFSVYFFLFFDPIKKSFTLIYKHNLTRIYEQPIQSHGQRVGLLNQMNLLNLVQISRTRRILLCFHI